MMLVLLPAEYRRRDESLSEALLAPAVRLPMLLTSKLQPRMRLLPRTAMWDDADIGLPQTWLALFFAVRVHLRIGGFVLNIEMHQYRIFSIVKKSRIGMQGLELRLCLCHRCQYTGLSPEIQIWENVGDVRGWLGLSVYKPFAPYLAQNVLFL